MSLLILSVLACAPECEDTGAGTYTYVVDRYTPDAGCWEADVAIEVDATYWPDPEEWDDVGFDPVVVPFDVGVCVMPKLYVYVNYWDGVADDPEVCIAEECFDACLAHLDDPVWCAS